MISFVRHCEILIHSTSIMYYPASYSFIALILSVLLLISDVQTSTKHNVLVILIDDLRHLSDDMVYLPNIAKLKANGVSFENAFAQQALCAPSRNSLLTGRRPDSLRLYDFYSYWRKTVGNFTTLPQHFKDNGYETYSVGKVFHPGKSSNYIDDYPYSWSHFPYHPPTEIFADSAVCKDHVTKRLQSNLICPVNVEKQPEKSLPDLESLEYAIGILKRNSSKPFLLAVGFHKPHIPFKYPRRYLHRVPISQVQPPKHPNIPVSMPQVAWHPWTDLRKRDDIERLNISFPFGLMPPKWTLKIRQSYYAAAIYTDNLIGELISHVDLRNTIVVLTSDHGWSLGENGLWAKYSNFDVALKVPLVFLAPNLEHRIIQSPVELVDLFPTLVDLAGIDNKISKCQNHMDKRDLCFEGKSLVPLMLGANLPNLYAMSQYPRPSVHPQKKSDKPRLKYIKIMGYSIRTKRYRYTEWIYFNNTIFLIDWNKIYGLELYDHVTDPEESNNVYSMESYSKVKEELSKLLRSHINNNCIKDDSR